MAERPPRSLHGDETEMACCYTQFDRIVGLPFGTRREAELTEWAEFWGPALTNDIRPWKPA